MYSYFSLRGKLTYLSVALLGLLLATPAAAQAPFDPPGLDRAMAAKDFHVDGLMATDGVVGVAVGVTARGRAAIVIMTEDLRVTGLAQSLDGVPVVVRFTGAFHAINPPPHNHGGGGGGGGGGEEIDPTSSFVRPVPIGVATGSGATDDNGNVLSCSSGTIGARVTDGTDVYALSNNHVYALENDAPLGSDVLQPGLFDTNCAIDPVDVIGTLDAFVDIVFDGDTVNPTQNMIDAAIAAVEMMGDGTPKVGTSTPSDGYGTPNSTTADPAACLNKRVQKYGRTTSLTKGTAFAINATVSVDYRNSATDPPKIALFVQQIVVDGGKGGFILAGDSGSLLVLKRGKKPCGLLFAGSTFGRYGIANPIDDVLDAFGVTIDGE